MSTPNQVLLLDPPTPRLVSAIEAGGGEVIERAALDSQRPPLCAFISGRGAARRLSTFREDPLTFGVPVLARVRHPAERMFRAAFIAGADDAVVADDFGGVTRRISALRESAVSKVQPRGRVVILDADVERRCRFGRVLRRAGMELEFGADLSAARAGEAPDVVVVHHSLADADLRHAVRERFGALGLPVVVIGESSDGDAGGWGVDLFGTVPANVPADHLLFVVNELLHPGLAEQRSSARILFSTLCAFRQPGQMTPSYGVTYNISRDGVFVRTLDPPPIDAPVWLEFRPPYSVDAVHLRGTVVWRSFVGGTTPAGFAVRLRAHDCPTTDLTTYRGQYRRLLGESRSGAPRDTSASSLDLETEETRGGSARILVADDDEAVRASMARLFRDTDIEVTVAEDGERAVELYRTGRYDAVVTDVHMPKLDGIDLLKAIRVDDAEMPVIITTGDPTTDSAIQAVEHGAIKYLLKPIDPKQLHDTVSNAIGMRRLAAFHRQAALMAARSTDVEKIADLDAAMDRAIDQLFAHYQPIVSLTEGRVFAYEALARTGEATFPHPGALFDAAERLDRVEDVGRRMRSVAPAPFAESPRQLFINLHPTDLMDDQLFDPASPLGRMADRVVLEITERASLAGVSDLRERIAALRDIGYRIAVDDLGAGYAGLSAFCALAPDVVKIDMSLIRDIHESDTKQRLVRSILGVCVDLGIAVVAEGVETREELSVLRDIGCTLFQGYYFARPSAELVEPAPSQYLID